MDKKYSVLITYNIWAWLETQLLLGHDRINKQYYKIVPSKAQITCGVCRYDSEHLEISESDPFKTHICVNCPMINRWPTIYGGVTMDCANKISCYTAFKKEKKDLRKKALYAGNIAQALWKLYKELE